MVNRTHSTVQSILDRYKNENRTANKIRMSPTKRFNVHDER